MHTFRGLDTSCYACVLDLGEVLELALRMFVRRRFKLALRGRMDAELLDCFTESFFDIIYPTPPTMRQCSLGGFSVTPYM